MDERERRLRRTFGPPAADRERAPSPSPRRFPHLPVPAVAAVGVALLAVGVGVAFWLITPTGHVAAGCFWWTAKTVGEVLPGYRGCVRGYVVTGAGLAETRDQQAHRLSFLLAEPDTVPNRAPCPFRPGDAVVVRQHAIFDDGRTILIIDDCR